MKRMKELMLGMIKLHSSFKLERQKFIWQIYSMVSCRQFYVIRSYPLRGSSISNFIFRWSNPSSSWKPISKWESRHFLRIHRTGNGKTICQIIQGCWRCNCRKGYSRWAISWYSSCWWFKIVVKNSIIQK